MKTYTLLALAGALPFIFCAILPIAGVVAVEPFGRLDDVLASYGLAIICFLAGTHWAVYLQHGAVLRTNLYLGSNAILLAVWFSYLLLGIDGVLISQLAALAVLFIVDRSLFIAGVVSADYLRARIIATVLASLSIVIFLWFSW